MTSALTNRPTLRQRVLNPSLAAILVFFAILLGLGLSIYMDYGLAWDEPAQLDIQIINYRYIRKAVPELLTFKDRYYGPLFELMLMAGYRSTMDIRQVYLNRHLGTFLCFFVGCVAFFLLARRLTRSTPLALAGSAFLVLSPRIFADAFYNSKDVPFLVFYLISLLTLTWFLDKPRPVTALLHGLATGAMLAVRLPGLVIPALTIVGLAVEIGMRRVTWREAARGAGIYLLAGAGCMVLFWPILWHDPLGGLVAAWMEMSHYPHIMNMLYLGKLINSLETPWHYIPVWMAVTTPIFYLLLFGVGVCGSAWLFLRKFREGITVEKRDLLMLFGALLVPIGAVIALHSVLYDGWRQMFFVYTPFLLIALKGLEWGWKQLARRLPHRIALAALAGLLAVGLAPVAGWMIANHPFENVYFNRLAGPDMPTIAQTFMMDYWGLANRKGLEYIARTDPGASILIVAETLPGVYNLSMLPEADRVRIHVIRDTQDAKYYLANYYAGVTNYPGREVFSIQVDGAKILSVFKLGG